MPVRRTTQNTRLGYGVVGGGLGNPTEVIILSMRDICNEIPRPLTEETSPFEDLYAHYVYLQWRFSVNVGIADMEGIKQYFNPLGKAQFGRYAVSAFGYVTEEGFISYAKIKSNVYSCCVRYVNGDRVDTPPSDEPQTDFYDGGLAVGEWRSYGDGASVINGVPGDAIADGVAIYLPSVVAAANVGITYQYRIIGYTLSEYVEAGVPPVIIF